MISDYNFITTTELLKNFPVTQYEYAKLVTNGRLKVVKHKGRHKQHVDSVFALFYPENKKTIVRKWCFPYEDINERWRIICDGLKAFPVCFLLLDKEHENGIYRVYSKDKVLKFFMLVEGRDCTLQAYTRDVLDDFKAFSRAELTWDIND